MEMTHKNQEEITRKGNPRKPQGEEGEQMLQRMNESHAAVTQWALGFLDFGEEDQALDIGCGGKMEVLEASVEHLPFEEGSFDKIITVESFYFWPDPAENLKEVLRILKKGGVFLLIADIYQKEGLRESVLENIKQYHLFNPTKEEFRRLFEQAGFAETRIHTKEGEDWICVEGKR